MESSFTHKKGNYSCNYEIDNSEDPCFVFVTFNDKTLIKKYGGELTIKTDFQDLLPFEDGHSVLNELRQDVFNGLKSHPEMNFARLKMAAFTKGKIK